MHGLRDTQAAACANLQVPAGVCPTWRAHSPCADAGTPESTLWSSAIGHEGRTRVVVQRLVVGPQEGIASVHQVEQPLGSRTRQLLSGGQQAANSVPASGSGSGGSTPRRQLPRAAPWLRRPPRALTGSGFSPCPVSAAAGRQESKLRSVAQGGGQQTAGSARAWQLQVLWGRSIMRSAFLTGSFARLLCSCTPQMRGG